MAKKQITLDDLFKPPTEEEQQKAKTMITRQRVELLCSTQQSPFFAHLAMNLILKEEPGCGTMATDGTYLLYNSKWVLSLSDDDLRTIICHEAMHPALGHLWRKGPRESVKWNWACDYVINGILDHNNFVLPKGLLDHDYDTMAAEEVYKKMPEPPEMPAGGLGAGQSLTGGGTLDNHDYWGKGEIGRAHV